MRFTAASLLAFASAVLAQTANFDVISQPTKGDAVPAGKTFTIVWAPSAEYNGTITLSLLGGSSPQTLELVSVIKTGVESSAGEFKWAVASTLGAEANYGIEITLDSDPSILEYSFPFKITGGKAASKSGSESGSASISASATGSAPAKTTATKKTTSSTAPSSTTAAATSSSASTTVTTKISATGNSTNTATKQTSSAKTIVTSTHVATKTGSSPSSTASTVSTNDAKTLGAGSLVTLIGGLAVAFFAL